MKVKQLIDKIAGRQQERQQQKVQDYRDLVQQIADGQEPDPATVESTLAAAGKSLGDLHESVQLQEQRVKWKERVALLPTLEKDQQRLRAEVAAADKALEEAEQLHKDVTAPLYAELNQIKELVSDVSMSRQKLFETCDNELLRAELNDLTRQHEELIAKQRQLHSHLAFLEDRAESKQHEATRELNQFTRESRQQQVESLRKEAEDTRQEIRAKEQVGEQLTKRREQVEQRMRDW